MTALTPSPNEAPDDDQSALEYDSRYNFLVAISGEPAPKVRAEIARILERPAPDAKRTPVPKGKVPRRPATVKGR